MSKEKLISKDTSLEAVERPGDYDEYADSFTALRDVSAGELCFWLDSLSDVAHDTPSTVKQRRYAKRLYEHLCAMLPTWHRLQEELREGHHPLAPKKAKVLKRAAK